MSISPSSSREDGCREDSCREDSCREDSCRAVIHRRFRSVTGSGAQETNCRAAGAPAWRAAISLP